MSQITERQKLLGNIRDLSLGKGVFEEVALQVFNYQSKYNEIFKAFLELTNRSKSPADFSELSFLPIQFFKSYAIQSGDWQAEKIFLSSGTTKSTQSRHLVRDNEFYLETTQSCFEAEYGPVEEYCYFALLPGYLEREGSSLIEMMNYFINTSIHSESGFYLNEFEQLKEALKSAIAAGKKIILIGVSYALMDFADAYPMDLSEVIVMETGGMKGKRKELSKEDLHNYLNESFNTETIHSEYGMTELLSQAYSKGKGIFGYSPTMQLMISDLSDPFSYRQDHRSGRLNIIDLANIDSCSFIATDDLGSRIADDKFTIAGRIAQSDIRGCNLLIEEVQ